MEDVSTVAAAAAAARFREASAGGAAAGCDVGLMESATGFELGGGSIRRWQGRGGGRRAGASAAEASKRFTPNVIDGRKCQARTLGSWRGGQCKHNAREGSCFCGRHEREEQRQYGVVTGPIPEEMLRKFEAKERERLSGRAMGSGVSGVGVGIAGSVAELGGMRDVAVNASCGSIRGITRGKWW